MSIAVLGAGAIGSLLGGRLSAAGLPVTLVDRGERARYLKTHGVTIRKPGGDLLHAGTVRVSDAAGAQHPHDVVILAVKSHEIRAALPAMIRQEIAATSLPATHLPVDGAQRRSTDCPPGGLRLQPDPARNSPRFAAVVQP